jgi:hypothetical protein
LYAQYVSSGFGGEGRAEKRREKRAYLSILDTSMISGMSSEKPAEFRALWIE